VKRLALLAPALLVGGCGGRQSMFGAHGAQGELFVGLYQIFLVVTAAFYLAVVAFLAAAILRRRRESGEGGMRTALLAWVAAISLGLVGLTLASWFADRGMARAAAGPQMEIELVAHQWWWDVRYRHPIASQTFRTANELHLPKGVKVKVTLKSNDVIHSFWVPNLSGKQDLIPGRVTDIVVRPEKEGLYRGQCAEFCGLQHAHMALDVTVESPAEFEAWRRQQLRPARPPASGREQAGFAYFMTRECATCHQIVGTPAAGQVAPDLTHLASRKSIAAGTLPMGRGQLYAWIADPQRVKPGNHMPYIGLEPAELHALVAYLESLK
jgi:cytochrome c oxidase subunit II